MKTIAISLLLTVALLTGGCSTIVLFASLFDPRPMDTLSYVGIPAAMGLGAAALCVFVIHLIRRSPTQEPGSPPNPDDRPKGHW